VPTWELSVVADLI